MELTFNTTTPTEGFIKINVKKEDYQPQVDQKIKEYRKKANLKGFRPGKVPPQVIKQMFGKSIMAEEVNSLVSNKLSEYIKDNDIQIIGEPVPTTEINDLDNEEEFELEYHIGFAPHFELTFSEWSLNNYKIKIEDKLIEETIENLKNQNGDYIEAETIKGNDIVEGSLVWNNKIVKENIILNLNEITENQSIDSFLDKKIGDAIKINFNELFKNDEERIKQVTQFETISDLKDTYDLKINFIKTYLPAEINQEFYDKIFGKDEVKSHDEFTERLKESLKINYDNETDDYLINQIMTKLVTETSIDLPEQFMKSWLKKNEEDEMNDQEKDDSLENYKKRLKWNLITSKISKENNIETTPEEVKERTKTMFRQQFASYGMIQGLEENIDQFTNNYLQKENGENYLKVREEIQVRKVLDLIKERIKTEEKEVTLEEFKKIIQE